MNPDRPVNLTSLAEHATQCNVGIQRLLIDGQCLGERVNRILLFTVQQKIESSIVLGG